MENIRITVLHLQEEKMKSDIYHVPYRSGLEMHTIIRCTIYLNQEITKTNKQTKKKQQLAEGQRS